MSILQVRKKADISKAIKHQHEIINHSTHHRNRFANRCDNAKHRAGKVYPPIHQRVYVEAGYADRLLGSRICIRPDSWAAAQSETHL